VWQPQDSAANATLKEGKFAASSFGSRLSIFLHCPMLLTSKKCSYLTININSYLIIALFFFCFLSSWIGLTWRESEEVPSCTHLELPLCILTLSRIWSLRPTWKIRCWVECQTGGLPYSWFGSGNYFMASCQEKKSQFFKLLQVFLIAKWRK
jgi:hypothetical protein